MQTPPDQIKRQIEAIVGHEIEETEEQLISLWYPIGSHVFEQDASVAWKFLFTQAKSCRAETLLDASGKGTTGTDGKRVFKLTDFVCMTLGDRYELLEPVNIVATPRSITSVFVTTDYVAVTSGSPPSTIDLQLTIFAWDANGAPAANVNFHWRCRVPYRYTIL